MADDRKDKAQETTPYEATPSDNATTEMDIRSPSLRPLSERFEVLEELGRGGMGIVYKARDREAGEVVAVKVLKPEISSRPDLIERFKAELRLARKVTHKNVCRTYDLHRFGPVAAIAMEFVEGESLRELLRRSETLSVRHGLRVMRQVIAGLREAHAQGVVHRDLKPENIVVARDGTVKVMDFGIARSVEAGTTLTASGMVVGTPAYMSPEQAEGKPADVRSDIYALGLILYEMFTGQRAFEADTPVALAVKQMQEDPPAPRELEPTLPAHIDQAILKCLEKKPDKRFRSVEELEAALSKAEIRLAPVEAETPEAPLPLHLARWQRLDWALVALAVVSGLAFFRIYDRVYPYGAVAAPFSRAVAEEKARAVLKKFDPAAGDYQYKARYWEGLWALSEFPDRVLQGPLGNAIAESPMAFPNGWGGTAWRIEAGPRGAERYAALVSFDFNGQPDSVWPAVLRRQEGGSERPTEGVPSADEVLPLASRFAQEALEIRVFGFEPRQYVYDSSPARRGWVLKGESKHPSRFTIGWSEWGPGVRPVEWLLPGDRANTIRVVRVWARADGVQGGNSYLARASDFPPGWHDTRAQGRRWEQATIMGLLLLSFIGVLCLILFIRRRVYARPFPGLAAVSLMGALACVGVLWENLVHEYFWLYVPVVLVLGWLLLYSVLGAAHHYTSRRSAPQLGTFLDLVRERLRARAAGLSTLRGVLLGSCYVALHTALLLALGTFSLAATSTLQFVLVGSLGSDFDSSPPAILRLVSLAVLGTLVGACALVALPVALLRPAMRTAGLGVVAATAVVWLATAFSVPGASVFPALPLYLFAVLQGLFFAVAFLRYDLVTCMAAMFTVATWLFCYPLYRIFGHVEFWPYSLVLAPWLLLVSFALLLWFRPELVAGWRRLVAVFE